MTPSSGSASARLLIKGVKSHDIVQSLNLKFSATC